ncbi:MAG: ATP-binding protein [Alphaproteobacteria bacterium]
MSRIQAETVGDDQAVERLIAVAEAFAAEALPELALNRLRMALDDLAFNAVSYGGAQRLVLTLAVEEGRLIAELADDGAPFDPTHAPKPDLESGIDERPIGGLGIHLVRTLMSSVSYRHADGMNRLRMELALD